MNYRVSLCGPCGSSLLLRSHWLIDWLIDLYLLIYTCPFRCIIHCAWLRFVIVCCRRLIRCWLCRFVYTAAGGRVTVAVVAGRTRAGTSHSRRSSGETWGGFHTQSDLRHYDSDALSHPWSDLRHIQQGSSSSDSGLLVLCKRLYVCLSRRHDDASKGQV